MATTNRELLAVLLSKLDISPQALSQQRKRLIGKVAMPAEFASYVIAHRVGIDIAKHLDLETVERVNEFDRLLSIKESPRSDAPRSRDARRVRAPAVVKEVRLGDLRIGATVLSKAHVGHAERMAMVYPTLYVFENSVREFIDGHLSRSYGKTWWSDSKIVSKPVRETVERNRSAESVNRYHSGRNARPIYCTNLEHLAKIVQSENGGKVLQPLFPRPTWFPELVRRFEVSRNVVAHMNPLTPKDARRLDDGLQEWLDQIAGHLPADQ